MKTNIQRQIEHLVTKGIGYEDTRIKFIEGRERRLGFLGKLASKLLTEQEVHDSNAGVQAHLYELNQRQEFSKLDRAKEFFDNTPWYIHPIKRLAFRNIFRELYEFDENRDDALLETFTERLKKKQSSAKLNYLLFDKLIYSKN